MSLQRTCALGCLAILLAACGGSGSETPPPVEPTSPRGAVDEEPYKPAQDAKPNADDQDDPEEVEADSDDAEGSEEEAE